MKVIGVKETDLAHCVDDAQNERVIITRQGKPIALVVGIRGMDLEQIELGQSDRFWKMIVQRRKQKTIRRADLEGKLSKPKKSRR